jgi:hypothetical protein
VRADEQPVRVLKVVDLGAEDVREAGQGGHDQERRDEDAGVEVDSQHQWAQRGPAGGGWRTGR